MELPNNANSTASAENNKSEWVQDKEIVNAQDPELAAPLIVDNRGEAERIPASEPNDEDYAQALADLASDPNPSVPSVTEVDEPTEADFRAALVQQERDFSERPPATFDDVSSMISDYDSEKAKQVAEIAKKLNTTQSNVIGLLQKHTFDELKNLKGLGDVTLAYPGLYNWAQDPKNYKSLIRDPERQKRISDNTEYLKKAWDETSRLGKANWAQMYQVSLMAMMSTGKIDLNEGTRKLRELDIMIRDNQTVAYRDAVQKFGKSFENLQKDFEKTGNIWGTISEENVLTPEGKLRALGKYYKGLTGSVEGVGEVLSEVIDNPAGFLVGVAGQSAYSFVPSILAGKTATVAGTLIAGPQTGIVAGLSAGVATQAFISYGQSFQQAADKFRDRKTGLVNYEKMFKDPEVLNDLRIKGAKYAGAHALFELVAGKFIKTNISSAKADMAIAKITGKGSQASIAAKATGKAIVADVAKEALGETTAQVAQGESISKAASEGFIEGLAGSVFGIGNVAFEWSTAPAIPVQEAGMVDLAKGSAKEIANIRNRPAAVMEKVKTFRHAMKAKAKAETAEGQAIAIKDVKEQLKNSELATSKAQAQEMLNDLNQFEGDEGLNQSPVATINLTDLEGFSENIGVPLINIVESLGDIAQRNYYEAVNNNLSDFTIPLGDFEVGSIDYDGLEDIAYFNDGEMNANEGKEINKQAPEALKAMEKDLDDTITFLQEDGEEMGGRIVYHGTPYDFEEFNIDFIGEGEGAQAFGWGIYFTDSKNIAKWYQEKNSAKKMIIKKNGNPISGIDLYREYFTPGQVVAGYAGFDKVLEFRESKDGWSVIVQRSDENGNIEKGSNKRIHSTVPTEENIKRELSKREGFSVEKPTGKVVEAKIPTTESFLDWDASFSEQNQFIKNKLKSFVLVTDSELVQSSTGEDIYRAIERKAGGPELASQFLLDNGIPGIKYFDNSSRKGKGSTRNYVVFDDKLIGRPKDISFYQNGGDEDGELPPIPDDITLADILGEEAPAMDSGEMETDMTGEDVQIVSRPVEVLYKGKTREQMEAFQKLLKALRNTVAKVEGMAPEMADVLAELQYNNLRYRSEVTGVPIMELAKTMTVSNKVKDKKARGETTFTLDDLGSIKKFRVALSAKAGIDTAIHEFAHVWIASMGEDVKIVNSISPEKRSEAQNNFIEVAQIAAEKLGLNSLAELSSLKEADQRRIQEVFAQTAESYFLKGEQPKGRMAIVMNMMRKWMANMARAISMRLRFSAYPTLAIDAKVQRIFETILRNESVAEKEVDDIFEGAIFDERILGARSKEYKELLNSIREEAIAKVYAKASTASFEEREKLIDAQLNSIYENARDEVAQSSVILFRDSIVNGDPDLRITHESIVQELAGGDADVAADLISRMPRKMVAGKKKAGMDVRFYMAQLGISDPSEMTTFLLAGANEAGLVDKAAQEMIDLFFPPMKTDKEIHEEAVQAVNGTLRERKIRLELSILADKSPRKLMQLASIVAQPGASANKEMMLDESMEGLQSKAVRFVNSQQVKTFRPNVILGVANRYGRKAAKYLAKGDFDAAFEMKEKEAMYVLAYKESLAKKKLIDQAVKRFKKYSGMSDRLAVQKGLAPELIAYINAIGNNMSGINGGFPKIFVEDLRLSKTIDASFEEKVNTRIEVVNAAMRVGNNADITVENFVIIGEVIKASASQARQSLAQHKVLQNNTIADAAATMAGEIGTFKTGDSKAEIGKRGSKTFSDVVAGLTADLQSVTNYFAGLFPSEAEFGNSMVGKMLAMVRNVEAIAQQNRDADWTLLSSKVKAIAMKDPTNRGLWKAIRSRIPVFRSQALGKPIPAPTLNHTFSNKGEIIRLIALMGSDSGRQAVIEGGITQDDNNIVSLGSYNPDTQEFESPLLDAFIQESFNNGTITKEDMDLVQAMWDINEKHYATVKEAVFKQFHFPIGYVKPKKISTPWGEYSGGYVPLHRAISTQKSNELLNKFTPDGMLTNTSDLFPFFTPAMAKERTGKVLPVSLDLSRLRADMNAIYRVGYMMNSMYAVAKVFAEPSFREAIESRRPGLMDNVLIPWVHRTLGQQYSSEIESNTFKEIAKVIQRLRRNQAISAFLFSPYTIAKQQLGVFPAASIVGQTRLYRSWLNVTLRRKEIMADISKRSNVMERRFANNTSRDIDSFEDFDMNFDKLSTMREFTEKLTYLPIQFSQNLVDAATFLAAEDFAKTKLKLDGATASKYAETVVERTQGSTAVSARPAVMYAGGEFGRLVTTFGSQILAIYGLNRAMGERLSVTMSDKKALRLAALGYIIGMTTLIPAIGGFMISTTPKLVSMGVDDEDEDKGSDYVNDMAVEVLKEMLDVAVPFIGNPLVTLAMEGRQQATGLIPMVRTVEAIARTGGRAAEGSIRAAREIQDFGDTDISLTRNELRDTLTAISAIVGDPLSSTIRRALGEYSKVEDLIEEQ